MDQSTKTMVKELAAIMGGCALICASVVGLGVGVSVVASSWSCSKYEVVTGRATKFAALDCYVRDDNGQWFVWEEYKNRLVARGELPTK